MNVILIDNVMLYDYSLSIDNMRSFMESKEEEFMVINIDTANLDLENNLIYDSDYEINISEIRTVLPRVDTFSDKLLTFTRFIRLNTNAKILNKGIYICNNKLLSAIHTTNAGISTIPTYSINKENIDKFQDFPYVLKSVVGYSGREVFKVNNKEELEKKMNAFHFKDLIIQPFREEGNIDYRIIVGNGKVIAAFKRTAVEGEFRVNTSQGGSIEEIEIDEEFKKMAIFTSLVLKMDFVGLDFIIHNGQFEFCEANNSFKIASEKLGTRIAKELKFISFL